MFIKLLNIYVHCTVSRSESVKKILAQNDLGAMTGVSNKSSYIMFSKGPDSQNLEPVLDGGPQLKKRIKEQHPLVLHSAAEPEPEPVRAGTFLVGA